MQTNETPLAPAREAEVPAQTPVNIVRAILVAELIGFAVMALFVAVPDRSLRAFIFDHLNFLASAIGSAGLFYAAHRTAATRPEEARSWRFAALAFAFWSLGDFGCLLYRLSAVPTSFPSWLDGLYLAYYPIFAVGVLRFPGPALSRDERLQVYLDMAIVILATFLIALNYLLFPLLTLNADRTFLEVAVALAYPLGDLIILWILIELLMRRTRGPRTTPYLLLAAAAAMSVAADTGFAFQSMDGAYHGGGFEDAAYTLFGVLGWLAGVSQANAAGKPRGIGEDSDASPRMHQWTALLPYGWVALVFAMFAHGRIARLAINQDVLAFCLVALVALVLIRQALVLRENQRLYNLVRSAHDELDQRIRARTMELEIANRNLKSQIRERQHAEDERRLLERQILQTQKLESLGILAGGLAHDFNNLLVGILGNADLALSEPAGSPAVRGYIEDIRRAGLRAAELTNQMLAYSGRGRFVIMPVHVNEVIEELVLLLKASLSKKITFDLRFDPDVPRIEADSTQIRQVIMNLITNAAEAIEERAGEITITTGIHHASAGFFADSVTREDMPTGDYVFVSVSDTGHGMDRNTLVRIFDPFFTTKFTGRGLGLSAVLGIVRGHRGAIKVDSQVGRGSRFTLYFPVPARKAAVAPAAPVSTQAWRGEGVVLLVDDEDSVREVCRRMLERIGFTVTTAADGLQAVEAFRQGADRIRAVLLDVTMPVMNGDEASREMKKINPRVPIILSSGYSEQDAIRRFKQIEIAGFIQKPFDGKALEAKLRAALDSRAAPAPAPSSGT